MASKLIERFRERPRDLILLARKVGGRAGWGIGDQAFSSLTNFALAILVARESSIREFGIFTLLFATYTLTMSACRAFVGQPFGIRFSQSDPLEATEAARRGLGAAFAFGSVVGVACILTSLFLGGTSGSALTVLGVTMPFLLVQDNWRYVFFSSRRGAQAFINDLAWAIVMFPVVAILISANKDSITYFTLAWAGAGSTAAILGCFQAKVIPRPDLAWSWWTRHRDLIPGLFGDFAAMTGLMRVSVYLVAAVAGLRATAAIRGANVLLGPVNVIFQGIPPIALPEAVRFRQRSDRHLLRAMIFLSSGLAFLAIGLGIAVSMLPAAIGRMLLHDTWLVARPLILPVTFMLAASAVNTGPIIGLRALGRSSLLFKTRIIASPIIVTGAVLGAVVAGAVGAAIGNGLSTCIADVIWWRRFRNSLRLEETDSASPATVDQVAGAPVGPIPAHSRGKAGSDR